jgi:N-acetylglucosaminyl-diphospho-decaprenol L-rhamnosyltransferase
MSFSVVIVAFKSEHLLEKLIKSIPKSYEVIVIENSINYSVKKNIEKLFTNSKVIVPETNLGYAKAINLGFAEAKNNFVWVIAPDVIFFNDLFVYFEKLTEEFSEFSIIAPTYKNEKIHKNYYPLLKKNTIKSKNYSLEEVEDLDWCLCLLNKSKLDKKIILDENFFLYFETIDLALSLKREKKKIYVIKEIKFIHKGTSSSESEYKLEILANRNWHYSWSKFYFYKKNYNYFYAIRKLLPNFLKAFKGYITAVISSNEGHKKTHKATMSGITNSLFLKSATYRAKIK